MICKTKLLVFFNLLQFIIFVKCVDYDVHLQFKINHLDNDNYKNIRIECQSDNSQLNISFVPNSIATNIYEGKACPENKYKLVIADQNNSEVNREFICPELHRNDRASLIPNDTTMFGVILYTVNIQNICDKSIIYVDRELFGTDKLFHSHSINRNQAVSSLANKKMTFMEEFIKNRELILRNGNNCFK
uniref:Uncharacterized protein n=1 Tax=Meloidogyne enterolobii TaxID=390850 RepID=A0A6V7TW24_MELEN|nr:unnamed protein product [Meloidogyne enterolobii]